MNAVTMTDLVAINLAKARASGLAQPVLLLLGQDAAQARAIFTAINGREMQRPPIDRAEGEEVGQMEAVELTRAAALLRQHAGAGGAGAARYLEYAADWADWMLVILRRENICVRGFTRDESWTGGATV